MAPAAFAATLFFFVFVFIIATKSINIHIVVNTYSKIKSQKVTRYLISSQGILRSTKQLKNLDLLSVQLICMTKQRK